MIDFTIIGYIGAIILVIHLIVYVYRSKIQKKKIKGGTTDVIVFIISYLLLLAYAIADKNYPFVIFFSATVMWGIFGWFGMKKRK